MQTIWEQNPVSKWRGNDCVSPESKTIMKWWSTWDWCMWGFWRTSRAGAKIVDINAMPEAKKFWPQPNPNWPNQLPILDQPSFVGSTFRVVMSSRAHECEYIITVQKILNLKHNLSLFAQPLILDYLFEGQFNKHGPKTKHNLEQWTLNTHHSAMKSMINLISP